MLTICAALTAVVGVGSLDQVEADSARYPDRVVRVLVGPTYRTVVTESVNGRAWAGAENTRAGAAPVDRLARAAAAYGAAGLEDLLITVEVPGLFPFQSGIGAVISPWEQQNNFAERRDPYTDPFKRAHKKIADRLEAARQEWLRENGFVGGVRTFVNTRARTEADERADRGLPEPRATIQVPDGARRKPGFRVDAGEKAGPAAANAPAAPRATAMKLDGASRISLPPHVRAARTDKPADGHRDDAAVAQK